MTDSTTPSKHRFLLLLCVLIVFVIATPFIDALLKLHKLVDIFLTIVFIVAMYSIVGSKKHIVISALLGLPMVFSIWLGYFFKSATILVIGELFGVMFIGFAVFELIRFILAAEEVTREVLFAAVIIYLLMALMWSFAYIVLETIVPGSFSIPVPQTEEKQFVFLYYSFVTITTLGYGDITPITHQAGALTILEAIVGQIYLVVLVSFLVGMFVSRRAR